jgi:hypothetical protein
MSPFLLPQPSPIPPTPALPSGFRLHRGRSVGVMALLSSGLVVLSFCAVAVVVELASSETDGGFDRAHLTAVRSLGWLLGVPLGAVVVDRLGGRRTLLLVAAGGLLAVLGLAGASMLVPAGHVPFASTWTLVLACGLLLGVARSLAVIAIVKTLSAWFSVRERGAAAAALMASFVLGVVATSALASSALAGVSPSALCLVGAAGAMLATAAVHRWVADRPEDAGFEPTVVPATDLDGSARGALRTLVGRVEARTFLALAVFVGMAAQLLVVVLPQFVLQTDALIGLTELELLAKGSGTRQAAALGAACVGALAMDRVFGGRRGPVLVLLGGVALVSSFALLPTLRSGAVTVPILGMSIAGELPLLVTWLVAMDLGRVRRVGLAYFVVAFAVGLGRALGTAWAIAFLPRGPEATDPTAWWAWPVGMAIAWGLVVLLGVRAWRLGPPLPAVAR